MLPKAGGDPIIEHHPVLATHKTVARTTYSEGIPGISINAVKQRHRIGTLNVDLAERRSVQDGDRRPRGKNLSVDRLWIPSKANPADGPSRGRAIGVFDPG